MLSSNDDSIFSDGCGGRCPDSINSYLRAYLGTHKTLSMEIISPRYYMLHNQLKVFQIPESSAAHPRSMPSGRGFTVH